MSKAARKCNLTMHLERKLPYFGTVLMTTTLTAFSSIYLFVFFVCSKTTYRLLD